MRYGFALCLFAVIGSSLAGGVPWSHFSIIDTPSAHLLRHTEVAVGVTFAPFSIEDSSGSSSTEFAYGAYLEAGVFSRGQVGATYVSEGGISGTARALLLLETIKTPGIAIGCENIIGEENYEAFSEGDSLYDYGESQNFSAYAVITKDFSYYVSIPVCASLGYGIGRFTQREGSDDGFSNPVPGLFGSIMFHPTRESEIIVEWDGRDLNAGGEYDITPNISVRLAFAEIEQNFRSGDERDPSDPGQAPKIAIGVQVTFGPLFNRTELDPYEKLRFTENDEALEAIRREREEARRRIEELERSIR
ncbi:MAG: hypothetical protein R6V62_04220 [Candidatus Fermentibacteraceae bacterium]